MLTNDEALEKIEPLFDKFDDVIKLERNLSEQKEVSKAIFGCLLCIADDFDRSAYIKKYTQKKYQNIHGMTKIEVVAQLKKLTRERFASERELEQDGKPFVCLADDDGELKSRDVVGDATLDILKKYNEENDIFYQKYGELVVLKERSNGWLDMHRIDDDTLQGELARIATYYDKGDNKMEAPPLSIAKYILNNCDLGCFPHISTVADHPIIWKCEDKGYKIVSANGYHEESGVYQVIDSILPLDKMSIDEAKKEIEYVFEECQFADKSALPGIIALTLTPIIRYVLPEGQQAPMCISVSGQHGAGKTYSQQVAFAVTSGRVVDYIDGKIISGDKFEAEFYTRLREGKYHTIIDDVKDSHLRSLQAKITAENLSSRTFYTQESATLENYMVLACSATNPEIQADMVQRMYQVSFEANESSKTKKYERDALVYVLQNRRKVLSAVFSIIDEWIQQGCKLGEHNHRMRSWAAIIGGILNVVPEWGENFLSDSDALHIQADRESVDRIRGFGAVLEDLGEGAEFTSGDVFHILSYRDKYANEREVYDEDTGIINIIPADDNYFGLYLMQGINLPEPSRRRSLGAYLVKCDGFTFTSGEQGKKYRFARVVNEETGVPKSRQRAALFSIKEVYTDKVPF